MEKYRCQWCGHEMQERYLNAWNEKYECKSTWACHNRARKTAPVVLRFSVTEQQYRAAVLAIRRAIFREDVEGEDYVHAAKFLDVMTGAYRA